MPLKEASRELTAFRTPMGLFQYRVLPMGIKTASAVFCRFLDSIVGDLHWTVALTYIDDVLLFTATEREHVRALDELLTRLDAANLTLSAAKTKIAAKSVQFLGHVIDAQGARPDPAKVREIQAIGLSQTSQQLQTALGSFGYYRRFIRGYAQRTHCLREKVGAKWTYGSDGQAVWTATESAAFFSIRNCLADAPILVHPDWDCPFEVHTDASRDGLGAVLVQRQDGKEVAISYASRALTQAEKPFAVWELEALASSAH